MAAMARRGVRLGWTGGVNRRSVAELAIAFMISLLRHIPLASRELRDGIWNNRKGRQLSDRTVGIVGCGHIWKDLASLLRAFECRVLVNDIIEFPEFYAAHQLEPVGLENLLRRADIVTLHVPLRLLVTWRCVLRGVVLAGGITPTRNVKVELLRVSA